MDLKTRLCQKSGFGCRTIIDFEDKDFQGFVFIWKFLSLKINHPMVVNVYP